MRKRINRSAVCSSDNYSVSRKAHLDFLKENHDHFCGMMISGELQIDVPEISPEGRIESKFKTIRIFGKEMKLTLEEFKTHYVACNF